MAKNMKHQDAPADGDDGQDGDAQADEDASDLKSVVIPKKRKVSLITSPPYVINTNSCNICTKKKAKARTSLPQTPPLQNPRQKIKVNQKRKFIKVEDSNNDCGETTKATTMTMMKMPTWPVGSMA
ncbi:hypothetical protein CY34DRAFT_108997 [Suillus luteus UH-Slu-Lm8-n1]|uniref:Uncharacterized protein n=1 Tax=Suillus luteus UH-Slu-Lm8-n1 TaxID=930992 RepID=A0A0D0AHR8_9AGAM|nr:hypothetical protein CY34DRAFT_108997 [Suillus luteus UH-Slu-Lm8-n1]